MAGAGLNPRGSDGRPGRFGIDCSPHRSSLPVGRPFSRPPSSSQSQSQSRRPGEEVGSSRVESSRVEHTAPPSHPIPSHPIPDPGSAAGARKVCIARERGEADADAEIQRRRRRRGEAAGGWRRGDVEARGVGKGEGVPFVA